MNMVSSNTKSMMQISYGLLMATFIAGGTWIIALAMCYLLKRNAEDQLLVSHCKWQIYTCWYSLLYSAIGILLVAPLIVIKEGVVLVLLAAIGFILLGATLFWYLYRTIRGFTRLQQDKAMYVSA